MAFRKLASPGHSLAQNSTLFIPSRVENRETVFFMQQIFEHYSAPKDSRNQQAIIMMEKARYARLDILKRFFRAKAQQAGVDYMTIADMLNTAPEIALGKTSGRAELNKKQKFEYALLSLGNSAAFSFQLVGAGRGTPAKDNSDSRRGQSRLRLCVDKAGVGKAERYPAGGGAYSGMLI